MAKCYPISLLKDCLEDECALQRGAIDQAQVRNKGLIRVHLSFLRVESAKSVSIKNILLTVLKVQYNNTCYKEIVSNCCGAEQVQTTITVWGKKGKNTQWVVAY